MAQVIMNELDGYKKEYGRKRRTLIENAEEAVYKEKEVEETEVMFLMDRFGYAKPALWPPLCVLPRQIPRRPPVSS